MTPLEAHLHRLIALDGPIPVARFMAEALQHPEHGYYMRGDPFGAAGDFTTAPEISQMFGELIGLWCAAGWQAMGAPRPARLVELGPGRGTLMADALRAARKVPAFLQAVSVHLVETSPALRQEQAHALAAHRPAWHERLEQVPAGPMLLIANEFFDALPIRQYQRAGDHWHERMVGADEAGLCFRLAPGIVPPDLLPDSLGNAPDGSIIELSPAREAAMAGIAQRLVSQDGQALVIDYGHAETVPGDTLQAVKAHRFHPVLAAPGTADLTAHVDFARLKAAATATGARCYGPKPQGAFLRDLGIEARAAALSRSARPAQAQDIGAALERLTAPAEMGSLFKVMAVAAPHLPPPAGFEELA